MLHHTPIFPDPSCPAAPVGSWIEIVYDASLLDDVVRPTLVIAYASGETERVLIPAPVLGRAIWVGRIPRQAAAIHLEGTTRLRVASVRTRGILWRAVHAALRHPRHALAAVALGLLGRPDRARKRLARALTARPLSSYAGWAARRRRPHEPHALDAPRQASTETFDVVLAPDETLMPWARDAVAAAFAANPSVVAIQGDSEIVTPRGVAAGFASAWARAQGPVFKRKGAGEGATHHPRQLLARHPVRPPVPVPEPADPTTWPKVTVIVPTRDRLDLLRICVEGVLAGTDYPSLSLLIADNGSIEPATRDYLAELPMRDKRARVTPCPGPFNFSVIGNRAAAQSEGEILVFLNNDIAVTDPVWLKTLVRLALAPDAGAVGPTLLYPNGRVQHAGVAIGPGGTAGHVLRGKPLSALDGASGPRRVSAVTGACLAVRRDRFMAVGGFDEAFAVNYNDIDLCLRLGARGWGAIWSTQTILTHRESASRGRGKIDADAVALFRTRWADRIIDDPAFHPAFSDAALDLELG